jgi:hypothetical protein
MTSYKSLLQSIQIILLAIICFFPLAASAGYIHITPIEPFPTSVNTSSTTYASYAVQNTAPITLFGVLDQSQLPAGMSLSPSSTCSATTALAPQATCIIALQYAALSSVTTVHGMIRERALPILASNQLPVAINVIATQQYYTITPSAGSGGSVSPATPQTVQSGDSATFTATPNTGYGVTNWSLDGSVVQTGGVTYTLNNITANHSVTVDFADFTPTISSLSPTQGATAGATRVNITGTNFVDAINVSFGSTSANFTVNSATSITAIAPPGVAGTVDITVTTADGTSAITSANEYTYKIAPTVSATNPTNNNTSVPISTNISITFSIPMDTTTLIPANFRLYNSDAETYVTLTNPMYSNGNKTVTFTTNTPLNAATAYQIILPAPENIMSSEGIGLTTGGIISSFTTAATGFSCAQTWVLNAGTNSVSACSSDSASGAIISCRGGDTSVQGVPLDHPTAMLWSGLALSITNASTNHPLITIDTNSTPSPPFTGTDTGSNLSRPTGLATLSDFGWVANNNSTLTYCTSTQTITGWQGCNIATPSHYPENAASISIIGGILGNPNIAGILYTANTASNTISACPINNFLSITSCVDAGGSGFNQPTFVGARSITLVDVRYVLITNKGNNTVSRCTFDNTNFTLSHCATTGSNFNQPVSIYESDNGFAYITNQADDSITVCTDTNGELTHCNSISGDFHTPVATVVGTCS